MINGFRQIQEAEMPHTFMIIFVTGDTQFSFLTSPLQNKNIFRYKIYVHVSLILENEWFFIIWIFPISSYKFQVDRMNSPNIFK